MIKKLAITCAVTLAAAVSVTLTSSCNHRDLCYDHSHWLELAVNFDWSAQPDARPITMVLYLFPTDGDKPLRYEFADINGSVIRVPAGNFDAVVFNGSTQTVVENGTTFRDFTLSTDNEHILAPMSREIISDPPRYETTRDQPVKAAPDPVWSDKKEGITIAASRAGQSLTFTPVEATATYTVILTGVKNLSHAIGLSASLSTMSESFSPATQSHTGNEVTVPLPISMTDATTASGTVALFGHCPVTPLREHILTIYTSDMHYYNFDVTSQIHNAPDPRRITISIDGIVLPEPDGTGMKPTVNGWLEDVNCDIDMN